MLFIFFNLIMEVNIKTIYPSLVDSQVKLYCIMHSYLQPGELKI